MEAKTKDLWVLIETNEDGTAKNVGLELLNPGKMMAEKPLNMPMIRDYLVRNKKYMQNRMLKYVVENINLF